MAKLPTFTPPPQTDTDTSDLREEMEEIDFGTPEIEAASPVFTTPMATEDPAVIISSPVMGTVEYRGIQFSDKKPDLKFAVETDKGILLCFSIIKGSGIYEIWKRIISKSNEFKRVANIPTYTAGQLAGEKYSSYLQDLYEEGEEVFSPAELAKTKYSKLLNDIGIDDLTNLGVWLDTDTKRNEVYEYKVRSITTPTAEDWSVTAIGLTTRFSIPIAAIEAIAEDEDTPPLDDLSVRIFGTPEYGWIIATLNPHIDFFAPNEVIIATMRTGGYITVPVSIQEFITEIQKGISSHGICLVIEKIAKELGSIDEETLKLLLSLLGGDRTIREDVLDGIRTKVSKDMVPPDSSFHFMETEKKRKPLPAGIIPRGIVKGLPKEASPKIKLMGEKEALGDKSKGISKGHVKIDMTGAKGIAAAFNIIRSSKLIKSSSGVLPKTSGVKITTPKTIPMAATTTVVATNAKLISKKMGISRKIK